MENKRIKIEPKKTIIHGIEECESVFNYIILILILIIIIIITINLLFVDVEIVTVPTN